MRPRAAAARVQLDMTVALTSWSEDAASREAATLGAARSTRPRRRGMGGVRSGRDGVIYGTINKVMDLLEHFSP